MTLAAFLLRPSTQQNDLDEVTSALPATKDSMVKLLKFPKRLTLALQRLKSLLILVQPPLASDCLEHSFELLLEGAIQRFEKVIRRTPIIRPVVFEHLPEITGDHKFKYQSLTSRRDSS